MTIKEFEKEQAKLLKKPEIRAAWLEYLSRFPHVSAWYRAAPQFKSQSAIVGGKKTGSDINLYKLFTEQCANLLREGGDCGIVIPSGIYTDLGAKGLRDLLFDQNKVTGLFCFENRKEIFEGVHRSFKFVVLTFEKGGNTARFPAAFMRHDVAELVGFPGEMGLPLSVELIRRLSPDSHSVMEFKSPLDVQWMGKAANWPSLNSEKSRFNKVRFTRETDPTSKPNLFSDTPSEGLLPLIDGRNIHQFTHTFSTEYRFWATEENYQRYLGVVPTPERLLDYRVYRLGFRKIARNTDERTMIATVIPPSFVTESFQTLKVIGEDSELLISYADQLYLGAVFNSFVFDALVRLKVTANMNFHFVYGTQTPDISKSDARFKAIANRAALLICTTPEFDNLALEVGLKSHRDGATDPAERARLRAELDGLIAHLYGLTEAEFAHVLSTFPLVPEPVKIAALNAYRDVERGLIQ